MKNPLFSGELNVDGETWYLLLDEDDELHVLLRDKESNIEIGPHEISAFKLFEIITVLMRKVEQEHKLPHVLESVIE